MNTLGERLLKLRSEKKLSREALGKKVGVTKTSIKNWEDDENFPKHEYLTALADFFGCEISYLTDGEGNPTPTAPATTEANLPSLLESSSNSVIDLMDNLRGLEKQGELTPELVSLLNATIDTFKKVKPQT